MKSAAQIAKELNVTPQTVRNKAKQMGVCFAKGKQNFVIDEETETRIKSALSASVKAKAKAKGKQKESKNESKNNAFVLLLQEQIARQNGRIEELERQREEQEKRHAEQIAALTAALQNITASLNAAQALHAGTLQSIEQKETIVEPEPPAPQEKPQEKPQERAEAPQEPQRKHWWQRWRRNA